MTMLILMVVILITKDVLMEVILFLAQVPSQFILFTDSITQTLYRMDLNTYSYINIPVGGNGNPVAVDYDFLNNRVYWTDVRSAEIWSSNLDGTNPMTVRKLASGE